MVVSDIYWGSVVGGPTSGSFQIVVELSKDGSTFSVPDLLALILQWTKERPTPLRIQGDIGSSDQGEMLAFCSTLRDFNYPLSINTDGMVRPNWFYLIPYIIVTITSNNPWLRFDCSEFRYYMLPGGQEPPFPPKVCPSYLIPGGTLTLEEIFSFLERSTRAWGVIHQPKHVYKKTLYQSKGGEKK